MTGLRDGEEGVAANGKQGDGYRWMCDQRIPQTLVFESKCIHLCVAVAHSSLGRCGFHDCSPFHEMKMSSESLAPSWSEMRKTLQGCQFAEYL